MKENINLEQIKQILEKANFSPSGDNCQPWEFKWNENSLLIFNIESRSTHPLDPNGVTSVLTLGCAIELIAIAASTFNFKIHTTLNKNIPDMNQHWAELTFTHEEIIPDELAPYISKRSTDRRLYKKGLPPHKVIDDINASLDEKALARLHLTSDFTPELTKYIILSEQFLVDHPNALPEVLKWVRFSVSSAKSKGDGISWRNMLTKFWELPLIFIFRKYPHSLKYFRPILQPQFRSRAKAQLLSASGLICVSIPKEGNILASTVDAGRVMMRAWLSMTMLGYGSHPFTMSSLTILFKHLNVLDDFFAKKSETLKLGEEILKSSFKISDDRLPVWVLRTGISSLLPENMSTFRKPISEIMRNEKRH